MGATRTSTRDSVLARLMEDYVGSCEAGQPLSAAALASRYPELADEVAACLASLDFIRRAAGSAPATVSLPTVLPAGNAGQLGDYRILREVGRGGMGVVYEAEQISLERRVALKVLPFAGVLDPKHLTRFKNEALAAAQLDHAHIVDVLGVGCERGTHFYAMRFIDGCTLADVIRELRVVAGIEQPSDGAGFGVQCSGTGNLKSEIPSLKSSRDDTQPQAALSTFATFTTQHSLRSPQYFRAVAALIADAADALHHAHEQGVIHRDIKPSNLMLDGRGKVWVTDFGLAHIDNGATLTLTGDLMGTLRYMSPEQTLSSRMGVDHRTDIYSLGATLYELLTLRPLFADERKAALLQQICNDVPRPPREVELSIPSELETITFKAIEKSASDRYETADQLAQDLRRFLQNRPILAKRPGPLQVTRKWAARHASLVTVTAIAALLLAATLGVAAGLLLQERRHTQAALEAAKNNLWAAKSQQRTAENLAEDVRVRLYAADVRLAFQAWNQGELAQTIALLDRCRPAEGQQDFRGFEWHYLWRLCHDERRLLTGHVGEVYSVAFAPDGRRLITAGQDDTAKVWDVATSRELLTIRGHAADVRAALYSPDEKTIATASDDQSIKLWNAQSGKLIDTLTGHGSELRCLAFSPDGRWLASGSLDDTARLWEVETRKPLAVLRGHIRGVRGVAFAPDGHALATAAGDHDAKLWNLDTFQERATLSGNVTWLCGVAFTPDGQSLATCCWGPMIKLWDVATLRERSELARHTNWVHSLAFSPDGQTLLSASRDTTVREWDVATGRETNLLRAHTSPVLCAAYSPDGRTIATAGVEGHVKLWDRDAQGAFDRLPLDWPTMPDPRGGMLLLNSTLSPTGERLAYFTSLDRVLRVLDLKAGTLETTAFHDGDPLAFPCLEISPDGRTVATGTREGLVQLWDYPGGKLRHSLPGHKHLVHSLAFSPDGRLLASGDLTSSGYDKFDLRLWEVATGRELFVLPCYATRDLAFSPDGRLLASSDGKVWRVADGQVHIQLEGDIGPVGSIRFSPDGSLLATGADDGPVKLWDAATGRLRSTMLGHSRNVGCVRFSPDGRTLVSGGRDRTIRLWHVATGQELVTLNGHESESPFIEFAMNGRALISWTGKELFLWPTAGVPRLRNGD